MTWSGFELFAQAGLLILAFVTMVWIYSLAIRNASVMDIFWGPGFILVSSLFALNAPDLTLRGWVVLLLVSIWGIRLAAHIGFRNHGQPEDSRYRKWREEGGTAWWWKSYFKVFLLQGAVMWLVSLVLYYPISSPYPTGLNVLDWLGIAVWVIGFLFESVADWQLTRFKANPDKMGRLFTGGLWSLSRHPNYFGEAVLWWGFLLLSIAVAGWPSMISPLLMTILLLKVSGVSLLEKTMAGSRPGLDEYSRSTPAFVPLKLLTGWWKVSLWLIVLIPCTILAGIQIKYGSPPDPGKAGLVEEIDLVRFSGDWHVAAGRVTSFEKESINAVESYRLRSDGTVLITYSFNRGSADGERIEINGTGVPQPGTDNAYWTVCFFSPLRLTYLVVDLAEDYSHAVVVSSDGRHVWVLSRKPEISIGKLEDISRMLRQKGYSTDSIERFPILRESSGQSESPIWRSFA